MPAGSRVRANNIFGLVTDNPLTASATTLNSNGLANLPAISLGTQHAVITLDPLRVYGAPEIIVLSNHSTLSTLATITRGAFGTTARSHPQGTLWTHTPMNEDYVSVVTSTTHPSDPYIGEIVYETDTGSYVGWSGSVWANIGGTAAGIVTLAYAEVTTIQSGFTAEADVTGLSVNVTVPAGRRIKISWMGTVRSSNAGEVSQIAIKEDNSSIQRIKIFNGVNATEQESGYAEVIRTPTAGTHNYKIALSRDSGAGTHDHVATSSSPAYILVEDITGSASPFATQNVPVGRLAYAEVTANQGSIVGTTVDVTGLAINISVPAGRVIRLTSRTYWTSTTTDGDVYAAIFEGATQLQESREALNATAGIPTVTEPTVIISPSAGVHTYKISAKRIAGTGTITSNANSQFPAFIMAEDITPTPTASTNAPNSTLGYSEVNVNQSGLAAGPTDLTGLSVIVTVPAGRRLRITGHGQFSYSDTTTGHFVDILEDGSTIGRSYLGGPIGTSGFDEMDGSVIRTPAAGTHTYKLTASRYFGAGTGILSAGATNTAFILVEDITGAVWPAGSQVTAGIVASEAWTDYTPTFTNLTVGNGVIYAKYMKVGRTVNVALRFTFGTTSAMGTSPRFTLPVAPNPNYPADFHFGRFYMTDVTTNVNMGFLQWPASATNVLMRVENASGTYVGFSDITATIPFTWATGHHFDMHFTYESAT